MPIVETKLWDEKIPRWHRLRARRAVKCRTCRWVFPGQHIKRSQVVDGECGDCRTARLADGNGDRA